MTDSSSFTLLAQIFENIKIKNVIPFKNNQEMKSKCNY